MARKITVELPNTIYGELEKRAKKAGVSISEFAQKKLRTGLRKKKKTKKMTPEEEENARQELLKWVGSLHFGHPDGANNEAIDRDLAREYGRGLKWD